jgi:outer membrane receptor for ferrienterochelin and colicins
MLGAIVGSVAAGRAQSVIEGTVMSGDRPLPGANVGVVDTPRGTATDSTGFFRLTDLPPGSYEIVVTAVGYRTERREVTPSTGDTVTVDISLQQTIIESEEIVVTGTLRETYVKDSPVKVDVVNTSYLQKQVTSNMMDVIGRVNGLSQQVNCGVCYTNDIRINGVEGANTAVLIDGMPIMGALASVYGLNSLNPSLIDQIEVIKGPSSTLYGTEALGGVVNVITKRPERTPSLSVNTYLKSTGETNLDLSASPDVGPIETLLGTHGVYRNNYVDENEDGFSDLANIRRISLFGKGSLRSSNDGPTLDVFSRYYHENRSAGVEAFEEDLRGSSTIYGESVVTRRYELLGKFTPPVFNRRFTTQGAYTYHFQDSFYGDEHYNARQEIGYGQFTWEQPLNSNSDLLLGGTLRYQTYNDNTPATGRFTRSGDTLLADQPKKSFIPGFFIQNETVLFQDLRLLAGLRLDHHDNHGLILAPRLSGKYDPTDRTTVRINTGTGFRVVNVFTEDHAALTGSREIVITEDLEPERSYNITSGITQIFPLGTNPLTAELEGFYTHFTNRIIPDYDADPNLIVYNNLEGHSVSRGLSLDLRQNFTVVPLTYNVGVTLLDVYTQENGQRSPVTYAPEYEGILSASYRVPGLQTTLDYTLRLTGPKQMPSSYVEFDRDERSPAFTLHTLQLTTELRSLDRTREVGGDLYFSIENLFNYTQDSPLINAENPFGESFDTVYTYGPIYGRIFSLGLRVNIR